MQRKYVRDRFITNKSQIHSLPCSAHHDNYQKYLRRMFEGGSVATLIERELQKQELQQGGHEDESCGRNIATAAEKVLDAPDLKDDYYLNLLDWSSQGVLAIGLTEKVYLYSTSSITQLCSLPEEDYVGSLAFHPGGSMLAVGTSDASTKLFDVETETVVRSLAGHTKRVCSAAFTYGLLYTGSRDSMVCAHDHRCRSSVVMKMRGHRGEVCGLKHNPCGLASGSNDNMVIVWDLTMGKPKNYLLGHKAAVKALSWCPWQRNLLSSGGGSSDKTIRLWNTETGKCVKEINAESQVCSLLWNSEERQLISSHGYSENQLCVWKVSTSTEQPKCKKIAELHGHTQRVLHMSQSPDASTICTASADETLRFWKVQDESGRENKFSHKNSKISLESYPLR